MDYDMKLIKESTEFELIGKSAVTIGKFDGIHKGHQILLQEILACKKQGMQAVVFTFDMPLASFFGNKVQKELTTKEEKRRIFEEMGIDVLIEFPINKETAAISPEDFIEKILHEKLHAVRIAAGPDLSFGFKGAGNSDLLKKLGKKYGYSVFISDKLSIQGREISSSLIREDVEAGLMEPVFDLTGRYYSFTGEVTHGKKLGRTINMPTINLIPAPNKLLPPCGVYYSRIRIEDELYFGITNIGMNPTVSEENSLRVETFIYDFNRDIYGMEVTVEVMAFKRPEMKFVSLDDLVCQLELDKTDGRDFFGI